MEIEPEAAAKRASRFVWEPGDLMRASDRNQHRDEDAIVGSLYTAFRSLKARYLEVGGWRYPGDLGESRGYGFLGPWAWSEGDYQYQFARALEVEFPGCVHLEMPLKPAFRSGLELAPGSKGTRHIDIVVSDLASLPLDHAPAGRLFRERTHEAFVEVKRFMKGREEFRNINWRDFCKGVSGDAARLSEQKARGWCQVAALLIVDDRGWHVDRMGSLDLPTDVIYFLLRPPTDEADAPRCPRCSSPNVIPIIHGMPSPELEERADRGEILLAGCLCWGMTATRSGTAPRAKLGGTPSSSVRWRQTQRARRLKNEQTENSVA